MVFYVKPNGTAEYIVNSNLYTLFQGIFLDIWLLSSNDRGEI